MIDTEMTAEESCRQALKSIADAGARPVITINILEYQYAPTPDGPWKDALAEESEVVAPYDNQPRDWGKPWQNHDGSWSRSRVVAYAPVAEQPRQGGADGRNARGIGVCDWLLCLVPRLAHESPNHRSVLANDDDLREFGYVPAESLQQQESGWVPVEERLPELGKLVLFWCHDWLPDATPGVGKYGLAADESGPWFTDETQPDRDELPRRYPAEDVRCWQPFVPPPPAERLAKEPSDG